MNIIQIRLGENEREGSHGGYCSYEFGELTTGGDDKSRGILRQR